MSKHPKLVSVRVKKRKHTKKLKIFKRRIEESGHLHLLRKNNNTPNPTVRRKQKMEASEKQNKLTMLLKDENGDRTIRLFTKKRKTKIIFRFLIYYNTYTQ